MLGIAIMMMEAGRVSEMRMKELRTVDSVQNNVYCNHDQKWSDVLILGEHNG
jgi:hypothetical protein